VSEETWKLYQYKDETGLWQTWVESPLGEMISLQDLLAQNCLPEKPENVPDQIPLIRPQFLVDLLIFSMNEDMERLRSEGKTAPKFLYFEKGPKRNNAKEED
jgi:hypothetical protein